MGVPTTVYIVANAKRKLVVGITRNLEFALFTMRTRSRGSRRTAQWRLVWRQDFVTVREAGLCHTGLLETSPRALKQFVEEANPTWTDLMPEKAVAGQNALVDLEAWLHGTQGTIADGREELRRRGIDPDDPGLGGVGAQLNGWPDFPTPRVGAAAEPLPVGETDDFGFPET